jgi:hypothetical protein
LQPSHAPKSSAGSTSFLPQRQQTNRLGGCSLKNSGGRMNTVEIAPPFAVDMPQVVTGGAVVAPDVGDGSPAGVRPSADALGAGSVVLAPGDDVPRACSEHGPPGGQSIHTTLAQPGIRHVGHLTASPKKIRRRSRRVRWLPNTPKQSWCLLRCRCQARPVRGCDQLKLPCLAAPQAKTRESGFHNGGWRRTDHRRKGGPDVGSLSDGGGAAS